MTEQTEKELLMKIIKNQEQIKKQLDEISIRDPILDEIDDKLNRIINYINESNGY